MPGVISDQDHAAELARDRLADLILVELEGFLRHDGIGEVLHRHRAEIDVRFTQPEILRRLYEVGSGFDLGRDLLRFLHVRKGDLLHPPPLRLSQRILLGFVGGLEIGLGDVEFGLDRFGRDGDQTDLPIFGLRELLFVIVVIRLQVRLGRIADRCGGGLGHKHIFQNAPLLVEPVQRIDERLRAAGDIADGDQQLPSQILLAHGLQISGLAHADVAQGRLKGEGAEVSRTVLERGVLHDLSEKRVVADAEPEMPRMRVDSGAAHKSFQHTCVESGRARLL